MNLVLPAPPLVTVPVQGGGQWPVRRVYCVGRNYEDHAKEMGATGREPPFFFMKPGDAVLPVGEGQIGLMPFPPMTHNLHHEVELVVAVGLGGRNIAPEQAATHVYGYAIGLDMTRRDLQNDMKQQRRSWEIAKAFDASAPIGPIHPKAQTGELARGEILLQVNGQSRQRGNLADMIWNVNETIAALSQAWALAPGDLIYTGTPAGVGAVQVGDVMTACIAGLGSLTVAVAAPA